MLAMPSTYTSLKFTGVPKARFIRIASLCAASMPCTSKVASTHKRAILMNLAFGTPVNFKDVYVEGIASIAPLDIAYATEFGYTIKLLAIAKMHESGSGGRAGAEVEARVHPTMIASDSPIARVDGVYNAIQVTGDAVGDIMLYGKGAGSFPTASAV